MLSCAEECLSPEASVLAWSTSRFVLRVPPQTGRPGLHGQACPRPGSAQGKGASRRGESTQGAGDWGVATPGSQCVGGRGTGSALPPESSPALCQGREGPYTHTLQQRAGAGVSSSPCFCPEQLLCSSPAVFAAVTLAQQCRTSALESPSCPPRSGPAGEWVVWSLPEARRRLIAPSTAQAGCLSSCRLSGQGPSRQRRVGRCLRLVCPPPGSQVCAMGRGHLALFYGPYSPGGDLQAPPGPCSPALRLPRHRPP